eukprot:s4868_g2.t1
MANPSKNPGVDATQPIPGTDMTGVELDLLRELMRKAERNQLMAHANSLQNLEHKNLQDPKKAEWEAQQRSQWPMPGYAAAAKTTVQAPPQNSGRPPKTSDANYDPADDPSVTGIAESRPSCFTALWERCSRCSSSEFAACCNCKARTANSFSCGIGHRSQLSSCKSWQVCRASAT